MPLRKVHTSNVNLPRARQGRHAAALATVADGTAAAEAGKRSHAEAS